MAVDFAADRRKVFDGVVAAAAVEYVVEVVCAAGHCDAQAVAFVVAVVEVLLAVDGDACGQEQEHWDSFQQSCRMGRRTGCNFVDVAVDSTRFEYSVGVEVAIVVVAAEWATEILLFELAAAVATFVVKGYSRAIQEE